MTKEKRKEYDKKYHAANREKLNENSKRHYEANKEKVKEWLKEYSKKYYKANKEKLIENMNKYQEANKEKVREQRNKYGKQRRVADPAYKLIHNIRTRHREVLKGKYSTTKGLGCNKDFLREYIENQWIEEMTWNNYGSKEGQWSLDHKLPLSLYYTQPELLPKLIHYTNMQPMWHVDNIKKSNS
jgi:hypothetical protein